MHATSGLTTVDWTIVALYVAVTIGVGWYFGSRQHSAKEYFVASGQMNPLLVGVSLFATQLSTISYLSFPGEALGKGPIFLTNLLSYPFVFLVVGFVLLPVYMGRRVTSAYELLESRLGMSVRLLGASLFLCLRLTWMSLLIYMTGKALAVMLDMPESSIPWISLVTGIVAIAYTTLGGLRAVVVTDLMQTVLLFGGAVLVVGTVTYQAGGLSWFPREWPANWDAQPIFSLDPATRVTAVGSVVSVLVYLVALSGGDQVSVQRFMATRDVAAARRALATQLLVAMVVVVTLTLVGIALLGHFRAHPDQLPSGMSLKANADDMFPHFITFHLPTGISGLVVSAMFAAAMSSIDSGINSITAVVATDFLPRWRQGPTTAGGQLRVARLLALGVGGLVVAISALMEHVPGNYLAVTTKTSNLLTVPIFCLFVFALFVPFAKPVGVWLGTICGVATAALIAFSGPLFGVDPETGSDPISFQWIGPLSLLVDLLVGCVVSLLVGPRGID